MTTAPRRTLSVLGTLGLIAALLATISSEAAAQPVRFRWLAAGDSYSSGHGIPGNDGTCQRHTDAWPVRARTFSGIGAEFFFEACSGAVTRDVFGQATALGTMKADLVTFSFGGNDIKFADIVTNCLHELEKWINPRGPRPCPEDDEIRGRINEKIARKYTDFLVEVANRLVTRGGNVIVVGYPALLADPDRWSGVAQAFDYCSGIHRRDAILMRGWAGLLNAEIGNAVNAANQRRPNDVRFKFVNVQDGVGDNPSSQHLFEPQGSNVSHNLCGSDPWIDGWTRVTGGYHPNSRGHENIAHLVAEAIRGLDWSRLDRQDAPSTPPNPTTAAPPPVTRPSPPPPGQPTPPPVSSTPPNRGIAPPSNLQIEPRNCGRAVPQLPGTTTCDLTFSVTHNGGGDGLMSLTTYVPYPPSGAYRYAGVTNVNGAPYTRVTKPNVRQYAGTTACYQISTINGMERLPGPISCVTVNSSGALVHSSPSHIDEVGSTSWWNEFQPPRIMRIAATGESFLLLPYVQVDDGPFNGYVLHPIPDGGTYLCLEARGLPVSNVTTVATFPRSTVDATCP